MNATSVATSRCEPGSPSMHIENSAQEWIIKGYRDSVAADSPYPTWIDHPVEALVARISPGLISMCDSNRDLEAVCYDVGRSLATYFGRFSEQIDAVRRRLRPQGLPSLASTSAPDMNGLPNPYDYINERLLSAYAGDNNLTQMELDWQSICKLVRDDFVFRRDYARLVSRHVAYSRFDAQVDSSTYIGTRFTFKTASRLSALLRVSLLAVTGLAGGLLAWHFFRTSQLAVEMIPGLLIFGFCFSIVKRGLQKDKSAQEFATNEVRPFVQLENAIIASRTEVDLVRCSEFARQLFLNGLVDAKYVENVLRKPSD